MYLNISKCKQEVTAGTKI